MALKDDLNSAATLVSGKIDQLILVVKDNQGGVTATDAQAVIMTLNSAAAKADEVLMPPAPPIPPTA